MTRSEYVRDVRQRIANNVRYHRQRRGWTQKDMADECGLSAVTVYLLENATRPYNIPITSLASLANSLQLKVEDFFVERDPPPNPRGKTGALYLSQFGDNHDRN